MALIPEWQFCFRDNKNIYDFMSICMNFLENEFSTPKKAVFVACVNEDKIDFENIRLVIKAKIKSQHLFSQQITTIKNVVIRACKRNDCRNYQFAVMYSVLQGINNAMKDKEDDYITEWGPLDTKEENRFRIYLRPTTTLLDDFVANVGRSKNIEKDHLMSSLDRFAFLDTKELSLSPGERVPVGRLVSHPKNDHKDNILRIGISPFCYDENFGIDPKVEIGDIKTFTISYPKTIDQKSYAVRARKVLEKASKHKCDFVIFPEYTCSDEVKDAIVDSILELKKQGEFVPLLVFAGTNWSKGNDNILRVFDSAGEEIGTYYKQVPYDSVDEHDVEWVESLSYTKGENTFFCLPEIGYIMPVVCKDAMVIDGPAYLYSKIFSPLIVLIPAWSKSINSFDRLTSSVTDTFTSFLVADACSAVKSRNPRIVGKSYLVSKPDTIVASDTQPIEKSSCDKSKCDDGCLIVIEYNFSYEKGTTPKSAPKRNTSTAINNKI